MKTLSKMSFVAIAGLALVGCGPDPVASATSAPAGSAETLKPFVPVAEAGIRREVSDPTELITAAKSQSFGIRANPFALHSDEVAFDRSQAAASLAESQGWYSFIAEERDSGRQETFENEPQPARRLAGILIGETVAALIDMGDGRGLQTIRPGQAIDGSEWVVQSIDEEKAILRREGSNKRPRFVVVRLEDSSTVGGAPATGGSTGGTGGTRGGRAQDGRGQQGSAD